MEEVLHADDVGARSGMLQLLHADIAQAYPGNQTLVAGCHHHGQLVVEARIDAAVAGQAEVDRGELGDPQAAKVILDARAQVASAIVVPSAGDLADDRQAVGIRMQRLADQVVYGAGAVVLGGVDVIDAGGYSGPQYADGGLTVRRRSGGELTRQLHRAVPRPPHQHPSKRVGRHHF